jgi:hypothetical protein
MLYCVWASKSHVYEEITITIILLFHNKHFKSQERKITGKTLHYILMWKTFTEKVHFPKQENSKKKHIENFKNLLYSIYKITKSWHRKGNSKISFGNDVLNKMKIYLYSFMCTKLNIKAFSKYKKYKSSNNKI